MIPEDVLDEVKRAVTQAFSFVAKKSRAADRKKILEAVGEAFDECLADEDKE